MFTKSQEQQQSQAPNVDDILSSFKREPLQGFVSNSQLANYPYVEQEQPVEDTEETNDDEYESNDTEDQQQEEQLPSSAFAEQFKQEFGIEPTEAVDLVNSLQSFRDEQLLMRQWKVSPDE